MSALGTGIFAFGTQIHVGDGQSPQNFYPIAGVGDIDGPQSSTDEVEKTTHGTGDPHHETIPGLRDYGQIRFPVNFDPDHATHALAGSLYSLEYLARNRLVRAFQIWIYKANGAFYKRQFDGWIMDLGEAYPVNGIQTRQCTIRCSTPLAPVA